MSARLRHEDGAAAVEFALIVGVLALLLFGMLQFGLAFFQLQNLRAAAREGARIGAVGATATQMKQRVEADSGVSGLASSAALSATPCPASPTANDTASVNLDLASPALPSGLKDIFTVNIPLMPPITINTAVSGEFRCEF